MPCIFPFEYDGETFEVCALDESGFWCSTKVDSFGRHIGGEGHWGTCGLECPFPGWFG